MFNRAGARSRKGTQHRGFSLLELVIVLAIILIVGAMAAPSIFTYVNNYKLKSSASQLAGLIQQCRINAVRTNSVIAVQAAMVNGIQTVYVDLDSDAQFDPGEPTMMMPNAVTLQTAGFPGDASTGLITNLQPVPVRFNARGIPCRMNAGVCQTDAGSVGFVYYLRNSRGATVNGWAAVRVNPVGRITTALWSGSSYQ